jgi:hypothetical protein
MMVMVVMKVMIAQCIAQLGGDATFSANPANEFHFGYMQDGNKTVENIENIFKNTKTIKKTRGILALSHSGLFVASRCVRVS